MLQEPEVLLLAMVLVVLALQASGIWSGKQGGGMYTVPCMGCACCRHLVWGHHDVVLCWPLLLHGHGKP